LPGFSACVGLDHLIDNPAGTGGQRSAQRGHDARRHAAGESQRVPERHDELADPQRCRVAERDRCRNVPPGPQHGEIGQRVASDDISADFGSVGERGLGRISAFDDMRTGEQESVSGQHARATGPAATVRPNKQARHTGQHPLGHAHHRRRVGVERVLVVLVHAPSTLGAAGVCPPFAQGGPRTALLVRQSVEPSAKSGTIVL
jgi:hypothetical protein